MSTQLDRVNAKYVKDQTDIQILKQAQLQKHIDNHGIDGIDELSVQGGIKQAAAVFSYEGMRSFSQLFSNSVEAAVERSLPNIMERVLERKITELLEGTTVGIQRFMSEAVGNMLTSASETVEQVIETQLATVIPMPQQSSTQPATQPVTQPTTDHEVVIDRDEELVKKRKNPTKKQRLTKEERAAINSENRKKRGGVTGWNQEAKQQAIKEAALIANKLKEIGKPVSASEVKRQLNNTVDLGNNPWSRLYTLIKYNENISRTDAGLYEYVDTETLALNRDEHMGAN